MEAVLDDVQMTDVPMHGFNPAQYLHLVHHAMYQLQWSVVALSEKSITCQTSYDIYTGSFIIIAVTDNRATISTRPLNEYYTDQPYTPQAIEALLQRIDHLANEARIAERNMNPIHREKWGALVPSKTYMATPLLLYANVLMFLIMIIAGVGPLHPTASDLFVWGGNLRPAVIAGEWWRLGSYMFLHAGAMHIIMNGFALLFIGMHLEPLIGRVRFTAAYLLTGVFAGLLSIAMHPGSVGVGASGAIFGTYGVFLALLTTNYIKKALRRTMMRTILFFVLLNLLWGLEGNTDNAAHIGGLIGGLLVGFAYSPGILKQHSRTKQLATTAALLLTTIAASIAAITYMK